MKTLLTYVTLFLFTFITLGFFAPSSVKAHGTAHPAQPEHSTGYHLAYKNDTLHLHANFVNSPVVGKESFLQIQAMNPSLHAPSDLADKVEVILWMPHMGHGSAPTLIEKAIDQQGQVIPGGYTVRKMYFVMAGTWEVRVTLTDDQGHSETQSFNIDL